MHAVEFSKTAAPRLEGVPPEILRVSGQIPERAVESSAPIPRSRSPAGRAVGTTAARKSSRRLATLKSLDANSPELPLAELHDAPVQGRRGHVQGLRRQRLAVDLQTALGEFAARLGA